MTSNQPDKYKFPTTHFFRPNAPNVRPVTPTVGNLMMMACMALVRSTNDEPWDRDGITQARLKALDALQRYAKSRVKNYGALNHARKRRKRKSARNSAEAQQQGAAHSSSKVGELGDFSDD